MRSLITRHKLVIIILLLLAPVFVFVSFLRLGSKASNASPDAVKKEANRETVLLACPGRVEGASEVINVGAGADGVIAEIRVLEGQSVRIGDVLAVIDRRDLNADLSGARAQAEGARQTRARIVRGSRDEERRQADAEANRRAAVKHKELVDAPPLPEELERADADVRAADERVRSVTERLEKAFVKAPISGTVLKTFMRPGETFSTFTPQPILSLADLSSLRVRAEVDERDIGQVHNGQRVMFRSYSFQNGKLMGTVKSIGSQMGRKKVRTGDPAEKADRDILEVLIDLDEKDKALVIGLRVTAQFLN